MHEYRQRDDGQWEQLIGNVVTFTGPVDARTDKYVQIALPLGRVRLYENRCERQNLFGNYVPAGEPANGKSDNAGLAAWLLHTSPITTGLAPVGS